MMDEVDIFDVACDRVIEDSLRSLRLKSSKLCETGVVEKINNMQDVFVIQTTEWRKSLVF